MFPTEYSNPDASTATVCSVPTNNRSLALFSSILKMVNSYQRATPGVGIYTQCTWHTQNKLLNKSNVSGQDWCFFFYSNTTFFYACTEQMT